MFLKSFRASSISLPLAISSAAAAVYSRSIHSYCEQAANITSPIKDKVVLITGATAGIGRSCAITLAKHDVKLVLIGRRADRLDHLKQEILSKYPKSLIHTVPLSVTDYEQVEKLPTSLPKDFRDVDILINNAGTVN